MTRHHPENGFDLAPDERLLGELNDILRHVAAGVGMADTLARIAAAIERLAAPAICTIQLVSTDGRHLRHGAAPSLPGIYAEVVEGLEIGPMAGACGTAAYRRQAVVIADTETDPLFEAYRPLARELNLRACWSLPVIDDDGVVIGTFALYHRVPTVPGLREWRLVSAMAGLVRVAIMQQRREHALRAAREEAEAASQAKSQFLAHMSHELRTPLNAILGFAEVIRESIMGPVAPRYRQYAADIHSAGQHLLSLINDVLDLAKIEVGRLELSEEAVLLPDLIGACRLMVDEQAARAGVRLVAAVPPQLPVLRGDRIRMKQVVLNLLSNAIKFTPSGGEVRIAAEEDARGLRLLVSDTGIGMKPEDVSTALAPFGQIPNAMNPRRESTGLGLPLAKTFVELHGGSLLIDSAPGEGTTVVITLPGNRLVPPA